MYGVGFSTAAQKNQADDIEKSVIENALKKTFAPEFLNRVDDIVIFNALEKEDLMKIVDIEIDKLIKRIVKIGYQIEIIKRQKNSLEIKDMTKNMVLDHCQELSKDMLKI